MLLGGPEAAQLADRLDQLASVLSPHAARAVCRWRDFQGMRPLELLPGQCDYWYRLLSGQKEATAVLEPANYVDAAFSLARKSMTSVGEALRPVWPLLLVAAAMLAGGVVLLVLGPVGDAVGITTLIAAFGLTWKTVGGVLGRLAGRLEAPLWGAELDLAVTDAITFLSDQEHPEDLTLRQLRRDTDNGDYAGRAKRLQHELGTAPAPPPR